MECLPSVLSSEIKKTLDMGLIKNCAQDSSRNIEHRDIKPHNLLISDGVLKTDDFGFQLEALRPA